MLLSCVAMYYSSRENLCLDDLSSFGTSSTGMHDGFPKKMVRFIIHKAKAAQVIFKCYVIILLLFTTIIRQKQIYLFVAILFPTDR